MDDKLYKIWLVVVWSDLGAVYQTRCALSYKPEQWFADMWRGCDDDYAVIEEFVTNLKETDHRMWGGCTVTRSDYCDNKHYPESVSDVGWGDVPVITFKPNGERVRFQEVE